MIEDLRRSGCWNTRAGDLLPLALANVTKRPVKIFTSRQTHPVVDIRPSIDPQVHVRMEPIYLTLTAPKNQPQHYDACIRRKTTLKPDRHASSVLAPTPKPDECEASPVEKSTLKHDDCAVDFSIEESTEKHGECGFSPVRASTPIHTGCDSTPPHESSCPTPVNISLVCASTSAYVDSDSTPVTTITSDDTNFDFFPNGVFTSASNMSDTAPSCESTTASPPSCYGTPAKKLPSPRKEASYVTPPKKKFSRKRLSNPKTWKNNIRKTKKLSGQSYSRTTGETARAKAVQKVDCSKCKMMCSSKISEEERQDIFQAFYSLSSYERQKDFVCH